MATTFYITAGLPAQDSIGAIGSNTFYITAGLPADDQPAPVSAARRIGLWLLHTAWNKKRGRA